MERGGPSLCPNPIAPPTAPPPSSSFGAIGYGGRTSGAWGTFYQWDSEAKADSVAKETCAQHGDDCKVIVYFKDGFGAVSSAEDTTVSWGLGHSVEQARADAQNKGVEGGGKNCEVKASVCSN